MFSFLLKKAPRLPKRSCVKPTIVGLALVFLTSVLFISCPDPNGGSDPVNAATPNITAQPNGGDWNVSNNETFELTVTASKSDNGTLSYQWYSNTTDSSTGGTATGTSSAALTLSKTDYTTNGLFYFYVVVTNTNNSVDGKKTASRTSNVATITVTGNGGDSNPKVIIPAEIAGHWQQPLLYYGYGYYADDGFTINSTTKTFYCYNDSTLEVYWGGTIVDLIPETETEYARLIFEVTVVEGTAEWWDPPTIGKYFAHMYEIQEDGTIKAAYPYSFNDDAKNEGVDTKEEAISEYTVANGYIGTMGGPYTRRSFNANDLGDLKGIWLCDEDNLPDSLIFENYYINIRGTRYFEFEDGYPSGNGEYDDDFDLEMYLTVLGDIVDGTDTSQASGILYLQVKAPSEAVADYGMNKFFAVAWQNKTADSIDFAPSYGTGESSLAEIKASYGSVSDFDDFYQFTKQ